MEPYCGKTSIILNNYLTFSAYMLKENLFLNLFPASLHGQCQVQKYFIQILKIDQTVLLTVSSLSLNVQFCYFQDIEGADKCRLLFVCVKSEQELCTYRPSIKNSSAYMAQQLYTTELRQVVSWYDSSAMERVVLLHYKFFHRVATTTAYVIRSLLLLS